jgi:4-hydroxy-4-methyl-2-oxoglutarate aldolase
VQRMKPSWSAVADSNLLRLAALDGATVSDAMDRIGIVGQCDGIAPRDPGFRIVGRAFTVRYGPVGRPAGTVGDYIDDVDAGAVVSLDNAARRIGTVWGDILTEVAHRRGIAGTVIDGLCRDVSLCRELCYPVFACGQWMRTGKDRVQVESVGEVITLGGVRVGAGDLLLGDADGVVALPRAHESSILDAAEEIAAAEAAIRERVRSGMTLTEARRELNYHALQSRQVPS